MSFKLLAIRPLDGCNPKFLKNLEENRIYQFYNDYEFTDGFAYGIIDYSEPKLVKVVKENKNVPKNLYEDNINISAIVGKNGSGKSALIELLIASVFKISLIAEPNFVKPEELYNSGEEEFEKIKFNENVNKFNKSIASDLKGLKVEIYYQHISNIDYHNKNNNKIKSYSTGKGKRIKCIQLDGESVIINSQVNEDVKYFSINNLENNNPDNERISSEIKKLLEDLYYSVIINYSHYGFNTNEIGEWIKGVFHKNDGYQFPAVINPYRDKGNIDVNSEKYLAESRFLVNVLQEKKLRSIQKNKIISHVSIKLDDLKFEHAQKLNRDFRILNSDEEKKEVLKKIFEKFYIEKDVNLNQNNFFYKYAIDYLFIKLKKMTHHVKYHIYKKCFHSGNIITLDNEKIYPFKIENNKLFENYLEALFRDFSHLTEKFRQTLFFLSYCYFDKDDIDNKLIEIDKLFGWINSSYLLEIENIKKIFSNEPSNKDFLKTIRDKFQTHHSLPSFFKIEYYFENKINNNNFSSLSSGEKQKIFSLHSVIYHIRNIVSVKRQPSFILLADGKKENINLLSYQNINIIFDEIELYAHPEFQKSFIKELLDSLKVINLREHYLNIIFVTHSPFILSDIPKQNVMFLAVDEKTKKSTPQKYSGENTFGANVHEMLTDGFFLENTKGEFVLSKIKDFLEFYNEGMKKDEKDEKAFKKKKNEFNLSKDYFKKLIDLIGEDYIKNMLQNHFKDLEKKFSDILELENEEKKLKKRLKEIEEFKILKNNPS